MRRRLTLFALALLIALSTAALGLVLSGEPTADFESAAAATSLASLEASLFLPAPSLCPSTCSFEGQCCSCGCDGPGSCVVFRGRLICLCSCSV